MGTIKFRSVSITSTPYFPISVLFSEVVALLGKFGWSSLSIIDDILKNVMSTTSKILRCVRQMDKAPRDDVIFDKHLLYLVGMMDISPNITLAIARRLSDKNDAHIIIDGGVYRGHLASRYFGPSYSEKEYKDIYDLFFRRIKNIDTGNIHIVPFQKDEKDHSGYMSCVDRIMHLLKSEETSNQS